MITCPTCNGAGEIVSCKRHPATPPIALIYDDPLPPTGGWIIKMWGGNLYTDVDGWYSLYDSETCVCKSWLSAWWHSALFLLGCPVRNIRQ